MLLFRGTEQLQAQSSPGDSRSVATAEGICVTFVADGPLGITLRARTATSTIVLSELLLVGLDCVGELV